MEASQAFDPGSNCLFAWNWLEIPGRRIFFFIFMLIAGTLHARFICPSIMSNQECFLDE